MPSVIYQLPRPFLDNLRTLNAKRDAASRQALSEVTSGQTTPVSQPTTVAAPKPQRVESTPTNNNLLGGSNPEELGIILLKAIQRNDKATWVRCINPEREESAQIEMANSFQKVRTRLEDTGVTDWKQVQFSRTTFYRNNDYKGRKGGSKFTIEFRYKNDEFLGQIVFGSISTATDGDKYLIWGSPYMDQTGVIRNPRR